MVKAAASRLEAAAKKRKNDAKLMYHWGYALALLGDEWAVNKFDEAIRGGNADVSADATIGMAEFLFEKKGAAAALDTYKKALKVKKPTVVNYARYKMGWINYVSGAQAKNRAAQKSAITQLAKLSKNLQSSKGALAGLGLIVKGDILGLVIDYGDPAEAQRILKGVGASDVYATFLEQLAYTRVQENKPQDAYKLFQQTIKERPNHPGNVQLSLNLAQLAAQMTNVPMLAANVKLLVSTYVAEKAPWRKKQKAPDLKKTDALIETTVFDYATALDQQGRTENKPPYMAAADDLYALFLKAFPKSPKVYDVKFFQAQLQYVNKKYLDSAQSLKELVNANPKGTHTKEALEVMVTACQLAVDGDKAKYTLPKPGSMKKPVKLPKVKQAYAECLELFVKYMPQNENAPAMRYAAATVYYDFGHYKDGVKRYFTFVSKYPTHEFAKPAAARIFEYYKLQKPPKAYDQARTKLGAIAAIKAAPELAPYFAEPTAEAKEAALAKAEPKKGKKGKKTKLVSAEAKEDEGEAEEAAAADEEAESEDDNAASDETEE